MQTIRNDMGRADFQRVMADNFAIGLSVRPTDSQPFCSEFSAYCGRNLQFASLRFSAHSTSSAPSDTHLRSPSRLLVTLQQEGEAEVSQGGRTSYIQAGQIFIVDPSRAFHIKTGKIHTRSVYLPIAPLRALVPIIDDLTAVAIDAKQGVGTLFGRVLDQLFELAPTLSEGVADRIAGTLPHLLSTALLSLEQSHDLSPDRLKEMHRQRIHQFIDAHVDDPELDAEAIAKGVGLSTRYVYELYSKEPETLMRTVWRLRLDRCGADLNNDQLRNRSIGEIAFRWGFSDVAHFSRAFREKFNCTARDWRKRFIAS